MKYTFIIIILICFAFSDEPDSLKTVAGYSCSACHVESGWTPISPSDFSHNLTPFPLTGFHNYTDCVTCHTGNTLEERHTFNTLSQNCYECHLDIHNSQMGNFCQDCHSTRSWEVTSQQFRHETTAFPLSGAHRIVDCQSCHESANSGDYFGESTDCNSCHYSDFEIANQSVEDHEFYPRTCELCHTVEIWQEDAFDHNNTSFGLEYSHLQVGCIECHTEGYIAIDARCESCHLESFNMTTSPSHIGELFIISECANCHNADKWDVSIFDHNLSEFKLEGNHVDANCSSCHSHGYNETTHECSICHLEDYSTTSDPIHSDMIYLPNDCESCHTPENWNNEFIHDDSIVMCTTCHKMDLINANDNIDGHGDLSSNCTECHNAIDWNAINYSHDLFNINSGDHDKLDSCNDCHIYNSFYTFSCEGSCHSHDQTSMYEKHCNNAQCILCPEIGIDYQNINWGEDGSFFLQCLMCHPNGEEDGPCDEDDRFKKNKVIKFQKEERKRVK